MKRNNFSNMLVVGFAATVVFSAGCAKEQVVRHQELVPPAASPVPAPAKARAAEEAKPKNDAVVAQPAPVAESRPALTDLPPAAELKGTLQKVYFDFDSYALSPQSRETLLSNAELLKRNGSTVRIEGHCDERGSDEYNLALGDRRAKAASSYLQSLGIPAEKLSVISYGEEKPAVTGHDDSAWAQNRRDEFVIQGSR